MRCFIQAYMSQVCKNDVADGTEPFIKKCVLLTWMMTVQYPPMCFARATEDDMKEIALDTSLYTYYVTKGETVAYVVWPCLLLHKDGPVAAKGVAEGKHVLTNHENDQA